MKPIESLIDKIIYRQLDVHDVLRIQVSTDSEFDDLKNKLLHLNFKIFEEKITKNGNKTLILTVALTHSIMGGTIDWNMDLWVEIQKTHVIDTLDHILYEIDRLEPCERFLDELITNGLTDHELTYQHEGEFRFSKRLETL